MLLQATDAFCGGNFIGACISEERFLWELGRAQSRITVIKTNEPKMSN
jgi:hypothetical protein